MTSDEKDNSDTASRADDVPDSSKRPSRTIELRADEVEIEVKPGHDEPDDADAHEDSADAEPPEKSIHERPPPSPARPPQRTRPSDVRSFVTHLAAGLIGGLIGVVGAGYGLGKLPLTGLIGGSAAPEQITRIEQRLETLDGKLEGQSKALEGVARTERLDKLDTRLAALENKPEAVAAVPQDLTGRMAKLEDKLNRLVSAGGEEGASGLEQSAALTARIEEVSSNFEKRISAFRSDLEALKQTLEQRAMPQDHDGGPAVSALAARLEAFEEKISELAARPAASAGQAPAAHEQGSKGAALALAFESLRRAVDRGEAFAAQLEALRNLAPEGIDLSTLAAHENTGVLAEHALLRALPPVLQDARVAAAKSDDVTFLDRLVSNAWTVVRVRRIGPAEGESADAVLARMEGRLTASDLTGILNEANGLRGPALVTARPWLEKARARQAVEAALGEIEQRLLARLKPDAEKAG